MPGKIERKTLKNGQNPLNLLTNLNIEEWDQIEDSSIYKDSCSAETFYMHFLKNIDLVQFNVV
jgi:hypothetical protein